MDQAPRVAPFALKQAIGVAFAAMSAALAVRLVWEQTVWSWEQGPQMVGFILIHSPLIVLLLALWAGLPWFALVLGQAIWKRRLGKVDAACIVVYALSWAVVVVPYGFWQRLFIDRYSPAIAARFFVYDAALGDLKSVEALLGRGIDVNFQDQNGTALHAAALQGELAVAEFLLSRGADVNALNSYGDTPLGRVGPETRDAAAMRALLTKHGGERVRGSARK